MTGECSSTAAFSFPNLKVGVILTIVLFLFITACSNQSHYAPVLDGWKQSLGKQGYHRVQMGETLYSIAWQYGLDYRDLVKNNHLEAPYRLHVDELLALVSHSESKILKNKIINNQAIKAKSLSNKKNVQRQKTLFSSQQTQLVAAWQWPTVGVIEQDYEISAMGNKGLDIRGTRGSAIKAAASGTVVYSGDGIRGYGNLLIIKHNGLYLSAYGHNDGLLVQEGQQVSKGEKIATMGLNEKGRPLLHFEIRRAGKPVNPHSYLGTRH